MPFDWNEYKILAEELRLRSDEASKRASISRLYYSVYWKARIFLTTENPSLVIPKSNAHYSVWSEFEGSVDPVRDAINSDGNRLKKCRTDADYEANIKNIGSTTALAFSLAESIIKALDSL